MLKKLLFAALALAPLTALASANWTLQGKAYTVDTLTHNTVGPGTTQTQLKLSGGSALRVHYTTIDLTNPNIDVQTVQAKSTLTGGNTLTGMVNTYKSADRHFVAGTNADFFGNSRPIGSTVVNGDYYYAYNHGWDHWAINDQKTPYVGSMIFTGTVTAASGASHFLYGINCTRENNYLVIYNSKVGSTSGTNSYGCEVSIKPVDGSVISPGKTGKFVVTSDPSTSGSMTIPSGGFVLSGHGTAATFIQGLSNGDEITIFSKFLDANGQDFYPVNMAGGKPLILSNGQVLSTQTALDHLTSLNPRTAVGYDATGTKMVLLVVDGRSAGVSVGVVSRVLADIMREVGCSEAMNFDGGGSSMFWVADRGIVNKPSDGKERSVVNGVFAVSNTPTDNEVAAIEFVDYAITLPRYGVYEPKVNTYNKYGVWLGTVTPDALSCPEALGSVSADKKALIASGTGMHALTAEYKGKTAKIVVTIGQGNPEFRLSEILLDDQFEYQAELQALVGETMMVVGPEVFNWSSSDASVAVVDNKGKIKGVADGQTTIVGTVGDLQRELTVNVECPKSRFQLIDPMDSADDWTQAKSNATINSLTANPQSHTLTLDYTTTSSRAPSVTLSKNIRLWSRPDGMRFFLNPGSGLSNVTFTYSCNGARTATAKVDVSAITAPGVVTIDWAEFFDPQLIESYPLVVSKILFGLPAASGVTNTVSIGQLEAVYSNAPEKPEDSVESIDAPCDNSRVEFYNLQGIRVDNPANGLYIRRQGNNVSKVLLK